jgi:hypothetical protein
MLRTSYTFRCETQEKTCRLGTNQAAEESGLRAVNCGFVSPSCAELIQSRKKELKSRYALQEAFRHPEDRALRAVNCGFVL